MKLHKQHGGFTLIQLMVVVGICVIIAQLTIAYCTTFDSFIAQSELMALQMFCQKMRYDAISSGQEQHITFDIVSRRYYTDTYTHTLPAAVEFGVVHNALGPPSKPEQPIPSFITFQHNQIHFFSDGTISSGIVYLVDRTKKRGYALTNGVGSASYLRLYRYDTKRWVSI